MEIGVLRLWTTSWTRPSPRLVTFAGFQGLPERVRHSGPRRLSATTMASGIWPW